MDLSLPRRRHAWAETEQPTLLTIGAGDHGAADAPPQPAPSTAEVRVWARARGIAVPDRGRLRPEIHQAWHQAHQP